MESLIVNSTPDTPFIDFDAEKGRMLIQGRAIPQDADKFWAPVLKWFYAYSATPNKKTKVVFNMEYYNISTSKQLLFILHQLNEIQEAGNDVEVEWKYAKEDLEMKEAGVDFSCIVDIPFSFICVESTLSESV